MTLSTDYIFLTDELEGFKICREQRATASNTMTVLLCKKGHIDVYYHGEMIRISAGDLFVRLPDFKYELGPYKFSDDFVFRQVTINAEIFSQIMFDHMRVEPNWWQKQEFVKSNPIFHINKISEDFFDTYFHLLTLQLKDKPTKMRIQILKLLAHGASLEMLNYMDKMALIDPEDAKRATSNHSDYIFHLFMQMLQENPHKREVQWFAQKLNITPKYLSEICKQRSGKAAGEWIADVTVAEIKHYLRNTPLPINEVVKILEFPNASFFCQYTKKHTGLTPNKFRKTQ